MKPSRDLLFMALVLVSACAGSGWEAGDTSPEGRAAARRAAESAKEQFLKADPSLKSFFAQAYGYAIFPTVGKGGVGVGGAYGEGVVFEKGEMVGSCSLTQGTIGLQLGGQSYSELIFFQNKKVLDEFKEGRFELGAQASAIAVTSGASADASYDRGVAIFTLPKGGLMFEASVGGQKFSYLPYPAESYTSSLPCPPAGKEVRAW